MAISDFDLVFFGGTGDLAMRKLLPALYARERAKDLPATARIICIGRDNKTDADFIQVVEQQSRPHISSATLDADIWQRFCSRIHYVQLDANKPADYSRLVTALRNDPQITRVFYLATPPTLFSSICDALAQSGLATPNARVVLEKPLGHDLASAKDVLAFRTTVMPPRNVTLPWGVKPTTEELERVLDISRRHFETEPKKFESVREVLEAQGVKAVRPLAYAARIFLPLVQASSNAPFGHEPGGFFTLAKTWLGLDEYPTPRPHDLARRYLAAHGPSLPADFAAWSGLGAAALVFEGLGDDVVTFKDERKRTLFDLKDAPRPSGDTPAPVRLLADFDGAVLGRADRTGIIRPEHAPLMASKNGLVPAMVLVDGFVVGTWRIEPKKKTVAVSVRLFDAVSAKDRKAIEAEAISAAKFLEPDAVAAVTFAEE